MCVLLLFFVHISFVGSNNRVIVATISLVVFCEFSVLLFSLLLKCLCMHAFAHFRTQLLLSLFNIGNAEERERAKSFFVYRDVCVQCINSRFRMSFYDLYNTSKNDFYVKKNERNVTCIKFYYTISTYILRTGIMYAVFCMDEPNE